MVLEAIFGSYGSGFGSAVVAMVAVVVSSGGGSGSRGRCGRRGACRDAEFGDMSEAELSESTLPGGRGLEIPGMETTSLNFVFVTPTPICCDTAPSTWLSLEYQNLKGFCIGVEG